MIPAARSAFDLIIGTRGSPLALAQTRWVRDRILERFPAGHLQIQVIRTSADRDTRMPIRAGSATGVFVKELEDALMAGEIDLAVHSLKDVPTRIPDALEIAAIPPREDVRDALVTEGGHRELSELPEGFLIGTGSVRRQAQLLAVRPDLTVLDIRGNVDTRMRKLAEGHCNALILACAGLARLGLEEKISARLKMSEMLPAAGQGALAIEVRKGDPRVCDMVAGIHHQPTAAAVMAERAFMRHLGGGCNSPVGVHAHIHNGMFHIEGLVASTDGRTVLRESLCREPHRFAEAAADLADRIIRLGGKALLYTLE
jgi:hydroxymethylbilane synthase